MKEMRSYYYDIRISNGKYLFVLYPCNNKSQELGHSIEYFDRISCKEAFNEFKNFVKTNKIDSSASKYISIRDINGKYIYEYLKDNKVLFYRTMPYEDKKSINFIINNIYNHVINNKIELKPNC